MPRSARHVHNLLVNSLHDPKNVLAIHCVDRYFIHIRRQVVDLARYLGEVQNFCG